jgi:hypothetical protein
MPDSISVDGAVVFSKITWDTDGSGKDVFAFGLKALPVTSESVLSFGVYPNPATNGHYKISVTLKKPMDIRIEILDIHKRVIETKTGKGRDSYLFPVSMTAPPGAYTVRLLMPGSELSRLIILQ